MAIKSVEMIEPNSCLNKADANEPIFVLRANDSAAPSTVRMWAIMYRYSKEQKGEFGEKQLAKYQEALQLAMLMESWKAAHP